MTSSGKETSGTKQPATPLSLPSCSLPPSLPPSLPLSCRWINGSTVPIYTNYSNNFEFENSPQYNCVKFTGTGWRVHQDFCGNAQLPFVCKAAGGQGYGTGDITSCVECDNMHVMCGGDGEMCRWDSVMCGCDGSSSSCSSDTSSPAHPVSAQWV